MKSRFLSLLSLTSILLLCGNVANAYESKASYYDNSGSGACGTPIDASSENIVALPPNFWTNPSNPNADPICNARIRVTYKGNSIDLDVRDKCPMSSCPNNKIDIGKAAFRQIAGEEGITQGIIDVHWEFISGNPGSSSSSGSISGPTTNVCSGKSAIVSASESCWSVWTSKCGNQWNENQFSSSNPNVKCSNLQIGQSICCGLNNFPLTSSSGRGTIAPIKGCSKSEIVNAGDSCWGIWVSKCGNEWNESQFFASNPNIKCSNLQIGQSLCCSGSNNGNIPSTSGSGSSATITPFNGCSNSQIVSASESCWSVWTSKCGNEWNESQFYASNPNVKCSNLQIGESICCGGSNNTPNTSSFSSIGSGTISSPGCSNSQIVSASESCWSVWTSKCGKEWNESVFYSANPNVKCSNLQIGQSLCCGLF